MDKRESHLKWWLKTIGEGLLWTGGYYATDLLKVFPEHTFVHQVALPLGFFLGFAFRKALGIKQSYQKDQLPSGVEKVMDKVPDRLTGIKGEKK